MLVRRPVKTDFEPTPDVVEQLLPDEVRHLTRCGRVATPLDGHVAAGVAVRRELGGLSAVEVGLVAAAAAAALAFLASAAARLLLRKTGAAIVLRVCDWRTNCGGGGGGGALRALDVVFRSPLTTRDDERRNGVGAAAGSRADDAVATVPAARAAGVTTAGWCVVTATDVVDRIEPAPRDVDDAVRELPRRGVAGAAAAGLAVNDLV